MGSEQSQETKTEILNSTKVKNSIKKFNESISEVSTSMMQTTMTEAAQGADVTNTYKIKGVKVAGDLVIGAVNQANKVKMNLSVLTKTELKADMVADMTNKLQTQLANDASAASSAKAKEGEQMLSGITDAISDTMTGLGQSMTGGSSSSSDSTKIQNIMDVSNETELINKVKNSVSTQMVNDTVTKVANTITGSNETIYEDLQAGGDAVIGEVNQENMIEMMTEAVTESGLGNKILAKMFNVDESEIKNAADTTVTQEEEKVGTLDAAGDAVSEAAQGIGTGVATGAKGVGEGIGAAMSGMMMPLIIIAGVGIVAMVVLKPLLSKGMDKAKVDESGKMTFGAGLFKGGSFKKLLKNSYIKQLMNFAKKYATIDNLIIVLALMVGYKFLPKIINFIKNKLQKEKFTNEKFDKKIILLKNKEGRYLIQGKDKLWFGGKYRTDGLKFLLNVFKDNKHLKLMMKGNDNKKNILTLHKKKFMLLEDKEKKPLKGVLNFFHNDNKFQLKKKKNYIGYNKEHQKFFNTKEINSAFDFYYDIVPSA
jgi:hypothetical protein